MDSGVILGITIVLSILVFLLTREFWCWYFKINKRVELLNKQNDLLLRLCKYEKYRMVEEGYIDKKDFKFINWIVDDNLNVMKKEARQEESTETPKK